MGRLVTWLGGALGVAALWRFLKREHDAVQQGAVRPGAVNHGGIQQGAAHPHAPVPPPPAEDPAAALRAKLDEARQAPDDRDEFDASEGQPLDAVEPLAPAEPTAPVESADPRSLDERRRAIHEKAQEALGEMQRPPDE